MLTFDLGSMSKTELEEVVSSHCSQFGTVKSVKIVPPSKHRDYAIVAVAMSTADEADRVVVKIGDLKFGTSAIIRLMHEEKQIPMSLKRVADAGVSVPEQDGRRSVSRGCERNSAANAKPSSSQPLEMVRVEKSAREIKKVQALVAR